MRDDGRIGSERGGGKDAEFKSIFQSEPKGVGRVLFAQFFFKIRGMYNESRLGRSRGIDAKRRENSTREYDGNRRHEQEAA